MDILPRVVLRSQSGRRSKDFRVFITTKKGKKKKSEERPYYKPKTVQLGVPLVRRATRPEWIYSQGVYFELIAGGEVRIFGFYNNKQTKRGGDTGGEGPGETTPVHVNEGGSRPRRLHIFKFC